jgi:hypothetical protein
LQVLVIKTLLAKMQFALQKKVMSLKARVCLIFVLNLMMMMVVMMMMMHNTDYEHAYTFYIKFLCVNNNYKYGNGVQNLVVTFASFAGIGELVS